MALTKLKGVIFDLDGVITGTARVHALAWESMFNDFLKKNAEKENIPFVAFDSDYDYLQYVDGKPRPEGVKSFLKSRGIELPFGELDDPPDSDTIPRKATTCDFSLALNINSCVAQACNSLLSRTFAPCS